MSDTFGTHYRWLAMIVGACCLLAASLHLLWMPHVGYDPLAPFHVFWLTIEGSYFPVAAFFTWLAARASMVRSASPVVVFGVPALRDLAFALVAALLLAWTMRWQGALNFSALVAWLALSLGNSRLSRQEGQALVVEWAVVAVLFAAASYAFTVFKSGIFHLGVPHDDAIIAVESALFGQPPLYQRLADFGAGLGPDGLRLSEIVYFQFFAHMLLVSIFLGARDDALERRRYVAALIICYIVGAATYYILPGLGPVFFDPDRFRYLDEAVPTTRTIQELLAHNTGAAQQDFAGIEKLDVYAFIACMPSLHLAHEAVMLYFSRRSATALLMSAAFFAASCVAVLVLGWHYAIDIPFGILLGIFALVLAGRLVRSADQTLPGPRRAR